MKYLKLFESHKGSKFSFKRGDYVIDVSKSVGFDGRYVLIDGFTSKEEVSELISNLMGEVDELEPSDYNIDKNELKPSDPEYVPGAKFVLHISWPKEYGRNKIMSLIKKYLKGNIYDWSKIQKKVLV